MDIGTLYNEYISKKGIGKLLGKKVLFDDPGCVHWSQMTGKMHGKRALGRPMTSNCQKNQEIAGCICQHCYATRINQIYPAMGQALQRNRDLNPDDIIANPPQFRLNSDMTWRSNWNGDYQDEKDVLIDFEICYAVDYATCTAWTKSPHLVEALDDYRPSNYTLMQSSPMINEIVSEPSWAADQIFTIYSAEFAVENDITINCVGACRLCNRCYGNIDQHRPRFINELLKGEEMKYFRLMGIE